MNATRAGRPYPPWLFAWMEKITKTITPRSSARLPARCQDGGCGSRRGRRAGGHQPDELGADDLDSARIRLALDRCDELVQRRGLPVLDVHAHLRVPRARQIEPEGAHSVETAVALAHDVRDLASDFDVCAGEIHVERDQRRSRADDHAAHGGIETRRAEIGRDLAGELYVAGNVDCDRALALLCRGEAFVARGDDATDRSRIGGDA